MPRVPPQVRLKIHNHCYDWAEDTGFREQGHATEVGMVVYAWNQLHTSLMCVFGHFIGQPHQLALTKAIWHSIRNDSSRRAMFRATAKVVLAGEPHILEDLMWLLDAIEKLARGRNDAVHLPVQVGFNSAGPDDFIIYADDFFGPAKAAALRKADLLAIYRATYEYTHALMDFLNGVIHQLESSDVATWPARPPIPVELGN